MRRIFLRRRDLHLVVAVLENLEGEIVAGIVVVGFLHHLDAGGLFAGHQLLGHGDSAMSRSLRTSCIVQPPLAPTRLKTS